MTALILVGHGSKKRGFDAPLKKVAADLVKEGKFGMVVCAYLGSCPPSIAQAIETCVKKGAREILVMPYFVLNGFHVTQDIPEMAAQARKKYRTRVKIKLCAYLGYDKKITQVVKERIAETR